jgi:hypothetical protein
LALPQASHCSGNAEDGLEEALARACAVDCKRPRHYIFGAAFVGVRQGQRTVRCCMAKAKKAKPREHLIRWRVNLIAATPATFIDFTMAPDAETAEGQVAEAYDIGDELRHRLVAIRDDL